MDITALFDDVDAAEHALVNLQSLGIFPTRYKIRALHVSDGAGRGGGVFIGNTAGAAGTPGMVGMVSNTAAPGFAVAGDMAFSGGEPPNREVQMLLTVEDPAAYRARSALISNHARRVRIT